MKKSKIIIPALAMLVISTAATVTGTVAWFTMNKVATAEGMMVGAKTSGSLIIKEAGSALPATTDKATKVTFNSTVHQFYPSTHDWSVGTATGLKTVTNGQAVNFETGTRMNSTTTLTYGAVAQSASSDYYFDYGLFLAGDGIAMDHQDITITLEGLLGAAYVALDDINGALSIDFYGAEVSSGGMLTPTSSNYVDTLNLAERKNGTANAYDEITFEDVTIPQSGTSAAYAITMRVYYDGALIQTLRQSGDPAADNDYAIYTSAGSGTRLESEEFLYYSDDQGSSIVSVPVGGSVSGLWKVDTTQSTLLFARSIDVADGLEDKQINIHIEAGDHH